MSSIGNSHLTLENSDNAKGRHIPHAHALQKTEEDHISVEQLILPTLIEHFQLAEHKQ